MEFPNLANYLGRQISLETVVEVPILIFIAREIQELKSHRKALEVHQRELRSIRPIISSLHTGDDVFKLTIDFTLEANEICGLGSIESFVDTTPALIEVDERHDDARSRIGSRKSEYIDAITKHIMGGKAFSRIIDFRPPPDPDEGVAAELLANIVYFIKMYEISQYHPIKLHVYHKSGIARGGGDFHFKCSDRRVILSIGATGISIANAALSITDSTVVSQYTQYFNGIIKSPGTMRLNLADLSTLRSLYESAQWRGVRDFLNARAATSTIINKTLEV